MESPPAEMSMRIALPSDKDFIMASWFQSYWSRAARYHSPQFAEYKAFYGPVIEKLYLQSTPKVLFVSTVPDEIVGYAVHNEQILHFTYIKQAYRRHGLATSLLNTIQPITHTHDTVAYKGLQKHFKTTFSPWSIYQ